jgi:hypothetical protein
LQRESIGDLWGVGMKRPDSVGEPSSFDEACIPARIASEAQIRAAKLDVRALWILSYIDGTSLLGEVLARAGLPLAEARDGVNDLVRRGIVALQPSASEGVWSQRAT